MALIHCDFKSDVLKISTSAYVVIPEIQPEEKYLENSNMKFQTLYLLHGIGDDHTKWVRRTPIERYARDYKLAVVMPQADKSFYSDMVYGNKYWTFISEELPKKMRSFFPLSDKREDNFVAGISMGGYGAFKLALNKPQCFAAAASFSGALDIDKLFSSEYINQGDFYKNLPIAIFGGTDKIKGSKNDLFYLLKTLKDSGKEIPKLYQCCGTEDKIYEYNKTFRNYAKKLGIDLTYEEGPGEHTWEYWDMSIQKALEWFSLKKRPV